MAGLPSPREALIRWAMRRSPPARSEVVLDRRRIYILPTRFGYLYLAVCLMMLLAAMHYGNSLIFLLVFLLLGLFANAMWQTHGQLLGLRISLHEVQPVHAGETLKLPLEVTAFDRRPRPALHLAACDQPQVMLDLPPDASRRVLVPVHTRRRGWLQIPRLRIASRFPLGLFEAWSWFRFDRKWLVYPAIVRRPLPIPTRDQGLDHRGAGSERGDEDFEHLREYQPGDPASRIAWKRQGHDGSLLSKQFAQPTRLGLWLDWHEVPTTDPELRLSILAGWVEEAERRGLRYGLRLPQREIAPDHGPRHQHRCLEALALHGLES